MASRPVYQEVLRAGRDKGDAVFLDVGCNSEYSYVCFSGPSHDNFPLDTVGTDVRKLAFDGYPARNIYACDLLDRFIELGHKLYLDKDSCAITFFSADIFSFPPSIAERLTKDSNSSPMENFRGRVTHLHSGLFFHLFDEQAQIGVAKRLAALLDRRPGSIIFGAHIGSAIPGEITTPFSK